VQTCFIFLPPSLEVETASSLVINSDQTVVSPLEQRNLSELIALQENRLTCIVLPAECVTLYQVPLPHLSASKAKTAIEFALEPLLPQPINTTHLTYVYNKLTHAYTVVVIDKQLLQTLIEKFHGLKLDFNIITVDVTILKTGEALYTESRLLVNIKSYQGMIPHSFEQCYESELLNVTCYTESKLPEDLAKWMKSESLEVPAQVWLARRVSKNAHFNLCVGEFSFSSSHQSKLRYDLLAGILFLIWILSYFISTAVVLYQQQHQIDRLDTQIASYYKELFPEAKQVITPRFRIQQLLKHTQTQGSSFWRLMGILGSHPTEIQTLRYQNQALTVTLKLKQFSDLQTYENQLRHSGIKVKQTQAQEKGKEIEATLELKP
jgi:general secretion pathway protein L